MGGGDLLIAPIQEKGKTKSTVLFPKGAWVNWWTSKVASDFTLLNAPLEQLPFLLKLGVFFR
jgi:alpha-glucosidase (family GH31 glycosyl hydrolase)